MEIRVSSRKDDFNNVILPTFCPKSVSIQAESTQIWLINEIAMIGWIGCDGYDMMVSEWPTPTRFASKKNENIFEFDFLRFPANPVDKSKFSEIWTLQIQKAKQIANQNEI